MEMVKMVASVAGEEVFVGECHPARARVLVKKQLASWKDGKILLHILNVHDKLLENNPELAHGPLDDGNVSKLEMERRLAWFRSFMEKSSKALARLARPLPSLEEAQAWASRPRDLEDYQRLDPEPEPLTDEEVVAYFTDVPAEEADVELRDLWLIDPDVGSVFGIRSSDHPEKVASIDGADLLAELFGGEPRPKLDVLLRYEWLTPIEPQKTRAEYEAEWRQDREAIAREMAKAGYEPGVPVAELVQVRYLWHHAGA
jgi:hypothetical protein